METNLNIRSLTPGDTVYFVIGRTGEIIKTIVCDRPEEHLLWGWEVKIRVPPSDYKLTFGDYWGLAYKNYWEARRKSILLQNDAGMWPRHLQKCYKKDINSKK